MAVRENQIAESDVLDPAAFVRLTGHLHERRQPQSRSLGARHILARLGPVGQYPRRAVEVPFAGLVKRLEYVLDHIARA